MSSLTSEQATSRIVIIGAGGHGKVVCDSLRLALRAAGKGEILGFLDDKSSLWGQSLMNLPILGPIDHLEDVRPDAVIVGIGENEARRRVCKWVEEKGYPLVNAVHPRAVVAGDVLMGTGVAVFASVVVNTGTVIGDNVILNTGCTIDHDCVIGSYVHIAPGAHVAGGVEISRLY